MITNLETYYSIAFDANVEMNRLLQLHRKPRPGDNAGFILTWDPSQGSFKQAFICIAFAGMYFEALVYIVARTRLSKTQAEKLDRLDYRRRLEKLGLNDLDLLTAAKSLQQARRELVHEKALSFEELGNKPVRTAQHVANEAIEFINQVRSALESRWCLGENDATGDVSQSE